MASGCAGFAGLPTYHRAQAGLQFMFVNGRPVRDKLLAGAIRGAYADLLMRGRFPARVLFIACPPTSSMSMCIPPRPKCASAISLWCAV